MKRWQPARFALACVACAGWMMSPWIASATAESTNTVPDVRLDAAGMLHGRLTDAEHRPLSGAVVQLWQQANVVATATTAATGEFALQPPHGGLFTLASAGSQQPVRCWTLPAAPPHAATQCHLVQGQVQRGQSCTESSCTGTCGGTCDACSGGGFANNCMGFFMHPIVVGTAIAAAIAIPLALDDDDAS